MHDDHRHHHHSPHDHGHRDHGDAHGERHRTPHPRDHNAPPGRAPQWQVPHMPAGHEEPAATPQEKDLDLVETAFIEAFGRAPDATSFLRLSGIPFVGTDRHGKRLHLLRVETEDAVDVGSVMPLIGGSGVRYDPLPARMISHRRKLAFVYHDGAMTRRLEFAEARGLTDCSGVSQFEP